MVPKAWKVPTTGVSLERQVSQPFTGVVGSCRWTTSNPPASISLRVIRSASGKTGTFEIEPFEEIPMVLPAGIR